MRLFHTVNTYVSPNQNERERNERARKTWEVLYQAHARVLIPAHSRTYSRSAKDIGDQRDVPYIRDIVQAGLDESESDDDRIMLTNADTSICRDAVPMIMTHLYHHECLYSHRRETDRPYRIPLTIQEAHDRGTKSAGVDLFAFRKSWWLKQDFPDLLLGYEGWDWVLKFSMGSEMRVKDLIYHEFHQEPVWSQQRLIAPGNLYNRKTAWAWLQGRPDKDQILRSWPTVKDYAKDPDRGKFVW